MKNLKGYILTREHNEYDQYGGYFVAWFSKMPTESQIVDALKQDGETIVPKELVEHILSGGGRQTVENYWWHLKPVKDFSIDAARNENKS